MRKIINGKLYDTEKSELLYFDESTRRAFYRTSKGAFFMFYSNGEIVPKTEDEAMEYLGIHDIDKYIEIWGDIDEA